MRYGRPDRRLLEDERGQASVEWVALILLFGLLAAAFSAYAIYAGATKGRMLGDSIAAHIICAVTGEVACQKDTELDSAYGEEIAAMVRNYAPEVIYEMGTKAMPVDFRICRVRTCSDNLDDGASISKTGTRLNATVFTRVVDQRDRGGHLYIQYWFYYPESRSGQGFMHGLLGDSLNGIPGYHRDDWESYHLRLSRDGQTKVRVSAHGGYTSCKSCDDSWYPSDGLYRVSGGSHAGQIPITYSNERVTPSQSLKLIPLETLPDKSKYHFPEISAPWQKSVYNDPESKVS